nr:hypothetical protein [Bacteroidales bacterium]
MVRLRTTDNNQGRSIADCNVDKGKLSDEDVATAKSDLQKIADVNIGKLSLDDNPNLLVFPRDLKRYGDE